MYQQQAPQPRDENSWSGPNPEYEAGYAGNLQQSDQLADAIARRMQAQTPVNVQMPTSAQSPFIVQASQRLALAIVSVVMLVPLSGIALGILKAEGLIALGIVSVVILGINFVFNNHR
ncbi:MAG: hypothetical protein ABI234_12060 [Ktedonobacteraceae bacterium]